MSPLIFLLLGWFFFLVVFFWGGGFVFLFGLFIEISDLQKLISENISLKYILHFSFLLFLVNIFLLSTLRHGMVLIFQSAFLPGVIYFIFTAE